MSAMPFFKRVASTEESKRLQAELYAAYERACQNPADPVAQKAFRQKFQQCRDFLAAQP